MFIKVNQEDFLTSLQTVQKAASLNTTLPILTGIYLKTIKDQVEVRATDLELSLVSFCQAAVEEEGSVVLPAKLVIDIFKHLPSGLVQIKTSDGIAEIQSLNSIFKIKIMSPEDFPELPQVEEVNTAVIKNQVLVTVLKQIIKSISRDESRPILTGALMNFNDGSLEVVSTDSYRLALKKVEGVKTETKSDTGFNFIIPLKTLEELQRQLSNEGETKIITNQSFIKFILEKSIIISRLLDGQFPNYEQLISKKWLFSLVVSGEELMNSISRVALISQKSQIIKVIFMDKEVELQAFSQGVGEANERLKVKTKGEKLSEIAFNAQYLIDGIQACLTENNGKEVIFELNSSTSPGIIKTKGSKDFLYLIMPLRL